MSLRRVPVGGCMGVGGPAASPAEGALPARRRGVHSGFPLGSSGVVGRPAVCSAEPSGLQRTLRSLGQMSHESSHSKREG